jgi:hypothetical protein
VQIIMQLASVKLLEQQQGLQQDGADEARTVRMARKSNEIEDTVTCEAQYTDWKYIFVDRFPNTEI